MKITKQQGRALAEAIVDEENKKRKEIFDQERKKIDCTKETEKVMNILKDIFTMPAFDDSPLKIEINVDGLYSSIDKDEFIADNNAIFNKIHDKLKEDKEDKIDRKLSDINDIERQIQILSITCNTLPEIKANLII